ncbi:aldehyde dehydrogenase family protein [Streptomyces sp. NPDC051684]|uniref:aldehyde dehydrogenase family protein n=1 Tax=Streptomyces sp. NPDC051684 TaxID=3365670 RepID=UPI0037973B35
MEAGEAVLVWAGRLGGSDAFVVLADADAFTTGFVERVRALKMGDPGEPDTQVAPLARDDLRGAIERQVEQSVAAGARLLTGGKALPGDGYHFQPTVLADTKPGMAAFDEETFGLGLSVWTGQPARGVELARRITSGARFINAIVASDPRLPFGGTKRSGYGREPTAAGIREFTDTRTYWIGH